VLATLRVLDDDPHTARIGRVATARSARGEGLAARLMTRALELCAGREIVLDAQTYLLDWYRRFGFVRDGEDFLDDGIPHVPMRLARPS
jgi:ElaA protein